MRLDCCSLKQTMSTHFARVGDLACELIATYSH